MYGRFACMDCKVSLWLGKAVFKYGKVNYFHIGEPQNPRNAQQPDLNRVLWKMLADHVGHNLCVVLQGSEEYTRIVEEGFIDIGGDMPDDISFEDYLKDWPG